MPRQQSRLDTRPSWKRSCTLCGNLEKRKGPAPLRSAVLIGGLLRSCCSAAGSCGDIGSGDHHRARGDHLDVGAQGLASVLSSAQRRPIDRPEDMPALFGIIVALCRRAGIALGCGPLFPSIRRSDGLCHRRWRSVRHRGQLRAAAPSHDPRADRRARARDHTYRQA